MFFFLSLSLSFCMAKIYHFFALNTIVLCMIFGQTRTSQTRTTDSRNMQKCLSWKGHHFRVEKSLRSEIIVDDSILYTVLLYHHY
jgi:hypothetical protein